ncbi:MAG: AAA family ATPase [Dehalococcoidia bacterium]|nr:AAA family ATPase [Dehalococcoidia bacterium]
MRITRIDIDGFGALHGLRVELSPRLNLLTGDNEAGKSTLQQAILALIYGFFQGGRVARNERAEHERFRPWPGGAYRGSVEYILASGKGFRIRRSFETDDVPTSVIDMATGRDLALEMGLGRHGNVPAGLDHLGMRREVFLNTCFVSQGALAGIDAPGAVSEIIASLADTGATDSSAEQGLRRLDAAISQLGSRSGGKPLPVSRDRLQRAKVELDNLKADYLALQRSAGEKDECEERLLGLRADLRAAWYAVVSKKLEEVSQTLEDLENLDLTLADLESKSEALRDYAGFPQEVRDPALAQKGRLDALMGQRMELDKAWEGTASQSEELRQEVLQCREDIETLEYARGFPLEREEEFQRLRFSLEESRAKSDGLRLDEEAMTGRQDSGRTASRRRLALASGLIVSAALAVWQALAGNGPAGLILVAAAALGTLALYFFYKPAAGDYARLSQLRLRAQEEAGRAAGLELRLMRLVAELGITTDSVTSGLDAFQRRLAAARELGSQEARLASMEGRLKLLLSGKQRLEDSESRVKEAERALRSTLLRAGLDEPDLENSLRLFEERFKKRAAFEVLQDKIASLKEQRKARLGNRTEADLAFQKDSLKMDQLAVLSSGPEPVGAVAEKPVQDLEGLASRTRQEVAEVQNRMAQLEAIMQTVLSRHRPRAEIEEDIARFEEEVVRLTRFSEALTLARGMLGEASDEVHRDFGPRLAHSLGASLQRLTNGRYEGAFVDPKDFSLRLQAAGDHRVVDIGQVSAGTREQAYLLLRIELARMLSASREPLPLFMDDPFVNFDEKRLRKALELLLEISEENQVLLFTKDPFPADWLKQSFLGGCGFKAHELPGPVLG